MATVFSEIYSLKMEHITKRFPGILACSDVSLSVGKGDILALVGENGAGKTTLMNVLMGIYSQEEGHIIINGSPVTFTSPSDALRCGIGMVHQQYMLVPEMTVTENIALGIKKALNENAGKGFFRKLHHTFKVDMDGIRRQIMDVSEKYGLTVDPDAYIWQLSIGEQQKVELVKTLCLGAKFLILDEPTSALTPQEIDELIVLLKKMSEQIPIIFISHKLAEVKALCNKMTVMRSGRSVYSGLTSEHSAEDIAELMTGHEVHLSVNRPTKIDGKPMLEIKDLTVMSDRGYAALNRLGLTVRAGEIMGLAGVSGNGQRELAEAISGLRAVKGGSIKFENTELLGLTPPEIVHMGLVSYIPEERNVEGIVPGMSLSENLILKDIDTKRFSHHDILNRKAIGQNARKLVSEYDVRASGTEVAAGSLSGGNIQKVILAREISRKPKFLVAVYPIRGLDMGAAEFIHNQLLDLRDSGAGILLISEEMDEVLSMSDRIAVIFKGQIKKVLSKDEADPRKIGILMAGVE